MHGLSGKLLILTSTLLHFLNRTQNAWTRKRGYSKINPTDQFDHVSIEKQVQRGF